MASNLRRLRVFRSPAESVATTTKAIFEDLFVLEQVEYHSNHDEQNFSVTLAETGENSMTIFVFDRRVLNYLGSDDCVLEREPLERLAKDQELVAFHHTGFFQAIDTFREFKQLNELWASGEAPWRDRVLPAPLSDSSTPVRPR